MATCSQYTPFKKLNSTVASAIAEKDDGLVSDVEQEIRRNKSTFTALLKHPAKDSQTRELVKNAVKDGIVLSGWAVAQTLPCDLLNEALTLSDMYNLNEISAVELLLTGESLSSKFPGWSRGLIAVLLYYDGRQSTTATLHALFQASTGRMWTLELPDSLSTTIDTYTNELLQEGIANIIIEKLGELNVEKEVSLLELNRALGMAKHRVKVLTLINDIKHDLAATLFSIAAQHCISLQDTIRLLDMLSKEEISGSISDVQLALLMAALYSISASMLLNPDTTEALINVMPLVSDPDFITKVHQEIYRSERVWVSSGLRGLLQLAWSVTLRTLSQHNSTQGVGEWLDEDEMVFDLSLQNKAFTFINVHLLTSDTVYKQEFYIRMLHGLMCDLPVLLPLKMKDLRNMGEEAARVMAHYQEQGVTPPADLELHFADFMTVLSTLYSKDPLGLELCMDYWCPEGNTNLSYSRIPHRQVSLHKFVRMAGDLLPPSLFCAYVTMLSALCKSQRAAHQGFNLLKANCNTASTVSWDHFFNTFARYFENLRSEFANKDTIYYNRSCHKGISPQEIQGLTAVLQLTRTVAEYDSTARIALAQHSQYMPVALLTGILTCSVPARLKAEIMDTLTAFSHSREVALDVWNVMENSQLLSTVQTTSQYQPGGIRLELEEVESRAEEFPLSRAYLRLLTVLLRHQPSPAFGSQHRTPGGLQPYLGFIQNDVLLKFNTRTYRNPEEKWEVGSVCLSILVSLLSEYTPTAEDFTDQLIQLENSNLNPSNVVKGGKPLGYYILVNLLQDTPLTKMILFLLDEGIHTLLTYAPFPGKHHLEDMTRSCLQLVLLCLQLQRLFIDLLRNAGETLLLPGIDKLLTDINPRTQKADHMSNIMQYLSLCEELPEHSSIVVDIVRSMCKNSEAHTQILSALTYNTSTQDTCIHGFTMCADATDKEGESVEEGSMSRVRARKGVLSLLIETLQMPAPNLAHYLLGFTSNKPLDQVTLQDPGVLGSPRTCLHAVISLLSISTPTLPPPATLHMSQSAELAYQLLYTLSSLPSTSAPILRYLVSSHHFIHNHILTLPRSTDTGSSLCQMAWLLKLTAIELRVASVQQQKSYLSTLISHLTGSSNNTTTCTTAVNISILSQRVSTNPEQSMSSRLLRLLQALEFHNTVPALPCFESFDQSRVQQMIASCEELQPSTGLKLVNVLKLKATLKNEFAQIQNVTSINQWQTIANEIKCILQYVMSMNEVVSLTSAKLNYLDGWRQVVEILLTVCPEDALSHTHREQIILEITQELLHKISSETALPELVKLACGVILVLIATLRGCYLGEADSQTSSDKNTSLFPSTRRNKLSKASAFHIILRGLIGCITNTKAGGGARARVHMYGAVLNFLKMSSADSGGDVLLKQESEDILLSYGETLVDVVCTDAMLGHPVARMEALSVLDVMVTLDRGDVIIGHLGSKGFLQQLARSLAEDNNLLIDELQPNRPCLARLELFHSKMTLLLRMCSSPCGAQLALQSGLMTLLSEMTLLDGRPEGGMGGDPALPSCMQRYRQIWLPTLALCQALLTATHRNNKSTRNMVIHFLIHRDEVILSCLRLQPNNATIDDLKELALLTSILAYTAHTELLEPDMDTRLRRLQRQLLSLLPRWLPTDALFRHMGTPGDTQVVTTVYKIIHNVCIYARCLVSKVQSTPLVFSAQLTDTHTDTRHSRGGVGSSVQLVSGSAPSLSLLISHLKVALRYFSKATCDLQQSERQLQGVDSLTPDNIRELVGSEAVDGLPSCERRALAVKTLSSAVDSAAELRDLCGSCIEHTLYLLWTHLQYYLVQLVPTQITDYHSQMLKLNDSLSASTVGNYALNSGGASTDDIEELKLNISHHLTESMFSQILHVEQVWGKSRGHVSFLEALVRRVKRIITMHTCAKST